MKALTIITWAIEGALVVFALMYFWPITLLIGGFFAYNKLKGQQHANQ